MDDIVEDARREVEVMLAAWQSQGSSGGMFRPQNDALASSESSIYFNDQTTTEEQDLLRVVVGDLGEEIQRDERERERQSARNIRFNDSFMTADEDTGLLGEGEVRTAGMGMSPLARSEYMSIATATGNGNGTRPTRE